MAPESWQGNCPEEWSDSSGDEGGGDFNFGMEQGSGVSTMDIESLSQSEHSVNPLDLMDQDLSLMSPLDSGFEQELHFEPPPATVSPSDLQLPAEDAFHMPGAISAGPTVPMRSFESTTSFGSAYGDRGDSLSLQRRILEGGESSRPLNSRERRKLDKPERCRFPGCNARSATSRDLERHIVSHHPLFAREMGLEVDRIVCKYDYCGTTFSPRIDNYLRHLRRKHGAPRGPRRKSAK